MVRRPLHHALDELRFGPFGTLNLRASLPTGAEAVKRTESWLRMKQAEGAREVLVITGRGNQSVGRTPVVREAVRRLLAFLSTRGVVTDHSEHSPGSFAVRLAPLSALNPRRSDSSPPPPDAPVDPPTLDGLGEATRERLRGLALAALHALGMRDPPAQFIHDEMICQCETLAATIPPSATTAEEREQLLLRAIERALDVLDDDQR